MVLYEKQANLKLNKNYKNKQEIPRPGDSEVTFSVFESSCHLLQVTSYYQSNYSKVEAIPLTQKCLAQGQNK